MTVVIYFIISIYLAIFSSFDSLGGGDGDRTALAALARGGSCGLRSRSAADGTHQNRILILAATDLTRPPTGQWI